MRWCRSCGYDRWAEVRTLAHLDATCVQVGWEHGSPGCPCYALGTMSRIAAEIQRGRMAWIEGCICYVQGHLTTDRREYG